jgi:CHASE2 domain-containing sensor protein
MTRRLLILSGFLPAVVTTVLALYRPAILARADNLVYDVLLVAIPPGPPGSRVAIVDVDERSLAAFGQWPWRRDLVGRLVARIRDMGATAIGLDMIFAEADRFGGSSVAPDAALANTLRGGGVVLGYALTFNDPGKGAGACVLHPVSVVVVHLRGQEGDAPVFRASGAICSLPALAQAGGASGFLNAAPDADGVLRRLPLLIELDGRIYPSLALAAVTAAAGTREMTLRADNVNSTSLVLDDRVVSLDGRSNMLLRYRGRRRPFQHVSAADVLSGPLPAGGFRGQVVFFGATALGTRDVVATPLDAQFAGLDVQATAADNLLQGNFVRRLEFGPLLEIPAVLALGVLAALLVGRAGLAWGSLAVLACLLTLWGGSAWLLSARGVFLSPLFPSVGLVSGLAAITLARLADARGRAERSGQEKIVAQRLMVQALLSLTEARDAETGRHSRRTQRYTRLLAEQLSLNPVFHPYLTPERIELLSSLAPLHDIGKVGLPDRLLNKPGGLTSDEFAEMKKHPGYGREVIVKAERQVGTYDDVILEMAKEIVYTHHERWDGTGYPERLIGPAIPIAGRLIALVDVYDALLSRRVYHQPISHHDAVTLILKGRGTHFDPAVVDAFLEAAPLFENLSRETDR